jgi:hypothetical protein
MVGLDHEKSEKELPSHSKILVGLSQSGGDEESGNQSSVQKDTEMSNILVDNLNQTIDSVGKETRSIGRDKTLGLNLDAMQVIIECQNET